MIDLSNWNNIVQILVGLATLGGGIYGFYRLIKKSFMLAIRVVSATRCHLEKVNSLTDKLNNTVFPIVESLSKEFSLNSGKSIKDQINRIDDLVRLSELRSKLLASSFSHVGIYECDASGKFTWVNEALCDIWGMASQDILGNGWLHAIEDDGREDALEKWMNSIKNDIPYDTIYTLINQKTKEKIKIRTTSIANKTIEGKILGYYGQVTRLPI
jgi:PAS domain S-box-containing protein